MVIADDTDIFATFIDKLFQTCSQIHQFRVNSRPSHARLKGQGLLSLLYVVEHRTQRSLLEIVVLKQVVTPSGIVHYDSVVEKSV